MPIFYNHKKHLGLELWMRLLHETVHKTGLAVVKMAHQGYVPEQHKKSIK